MTEPLSVTATDAKRIVSTRLPYTHYLKSYTSTVTHAKYENFLAVRYVAPKYLELSNPLYPVSQLRSFGLKSSATELGSTEIAILNHLCDAVVDVYFYMENGKYCLIVRTMYFPHTVSEIRWNQAMCSIEKCYPPMQEFAFYYDPKFLQPENLAKAFDLQSDYPTIFAHNEGGFLGRYPRFQTAVLKSSAAYSYLTRRMEDDLFATGGYDTQHDTSCILRDCILDEMEKENKCTQRLITITNRVFRPRELNNWAFQHITKTFKAELEADMGWIDCRDQYPWKYPELYNSLNLFAALRM